MAHFNAADVVALLDSSCGGPPAAIDAIQRHGLTSLITGLPASLHEISQRSGISIADIAAGVAGLTAAGRIEIDGDLVVGVAGLTTTPTRHTLDLSGVIMNTWCALDAVGIPVALGLDAQATTPCPHCGTELRTETRNGEPSPNDSVRLFCPTGSCTDVRADFCAIAELFCDTDHLNTWRAGHPSAQGQELTLSETAELGRAMWNPHAQ